MNIENNKEIDNTLQFFLNNASTIKALFSEDVDVTVTDCEKVLKHLLSEDIPVSSSEGRILENGEPIINAIQGNQRVAMDIPENLYGVPFTAVMVPIVGETGEVVGAIAASKSTNRQQKLKGVAEKFAASSQEISASTEELAGSASEFSQYMEQLAEAQNDMREQVESTSKILEMIDGVAKNTRVLGFNAGIEAARSGEHGRGFSVVAKEITRLANESANSVIEIQQLLEDLNQKVENVASIIKNTVQISTNQTTSIEEISRSIQHLTEGAEVIEEMAQEI
ncbi:methyl-accepting chemotaxis protein [Amphibacillus xylanus]|uniref:Methyl-accepting transducer domain-containing protein n=1 Tax=Amphibacillus xylanus (strain ATCC 51415 / DSM 6626 / JCM 7361 / LMG 17667 / NBRC 15112 / Ep01) TaxID=698758 RepID=K0J0X8_AMPXN|nr:methyl-accepting chemotaxis protein [Amphibacillus xylanus]BAM48469.1 hypothetical protein AXY_23370 [Amphibacillus xylanus NBRC 15112]